MRFTEQSLLFKRPFLIILRYFKLYNIVHQWYSKGAVDL